MRFHHPFLRALTLIDKEGAVVIIVEATDRVRSELSVDKAAQEMSVRILNCAVTNCPPSADDVPGSLSLIFTPAGGESIADLYRQAKNRVNFRLAAPTDISGLMVSSLELGPREGDPTVQLQMVDKRRGRLLRFEQGRFEIGDECDTASPSGANTPTPDSCSRTQTEVQGVAAVLERVEREDGVSTIQLAWRKDGIQYALNGINIPVEKVLQIARSIRPLDGSGD